MKKAFLVLALFGAAICTNAQIATENSKLFDNWSTGVNVGVQTPLDFNSIAPLNTTVGINIRKDLTPVVGFQVEYTAWLNDNHFDVAKTFVKGGNLGLNGIINWSNLIGGYNGAPRTFEISSVTGFGWLRKFEQGTNHLTAKTGLDLALNLGKTKTHSLVLTPAVYWNLNKFSSIRFDKRGAQLGVSLGYVYHFKTSNGTHAFKIHDVGAISNEVLTLQEKLEESNRMTARAHRALKESQKINAELVQKLKSAEENLNTRTVVTTGKWVVQFAQDSSELTDEAKVELDAIDANATVNITASASPEGTSDYNQKLSERRANAVVEYLTGKGVKVNAVNAVGAAGEASNRIAIVTVD